MSQDDKLRIDFENTIQRGERFIISGCAAKAQHGGLLLTVYNRRFLYLANPPCPAFWGVAPRTMKIIFGTARQPAAD
jgi:hypothetical protein